jgi:4-hydroxybutyryl-CoA dehydratase/vinylacetyl-CoA-Delta-isomerase
MKTREEYIESLKKLNLNVWMFGEKIKSPVDHPIIIPSMNAVAMTYELAHNPEYQDLMTATSHLTGKRINRFTHIYQNTEDLLKKVRRQRLLGQKTACCYQRCVGMDALNAVYTTSFEIDEKYGTAYHERGGTAS